MYTLIKYIFETFFNPNVGRGILDAKSRTGCFKDSKQMLATHQHDTICVILKPLGTHLINLIRVYNGEGLLVQIVSCSGLNYLEVLVGETASALTPP